MTDTREALAPPLHYGPKGGIWVVLDDGLREVAACAYEWQARAIVDGWRPPEPQAAPVAAEVLERAREAVRLFDEWGYPPLCRDRERHDEAMKFARAVIAEHARAEAAERERDEQKDDALRLHRDKMDLYEEVHFRLKPSLSAAEATVARLEALLKANGIESHE